MLLPEREQVRRDAVGITTIFTIGDYIVIFPTDAARPLSIFDKRARLGRIKDTRLGIAGLVASIDGEDDEYVSPNWILKITKENYEKLRRVK